MIRNFVCVGGYRYSDRDKTWPICMCFPKENMTIPVTANDVVSGGDFIITLNDIRNVIRMRGAAPYPIYLSFASFDGLDEMPSKHLYMAASDVRWRCI